MTGAQSRLLKAGARVSWRDDKTDQATVTDTTWSGVTLKWDSRSEQSILHNDMDAVAYSYPGNDGMMSDPDPALRTGARHAGSSEDLVGELL
jgi:hypothetical protein